MKVGDRVRDVDRDEDDAEMLVVALTSATAGEDVVDADEETTVADVNPGYDPEEPVVEVVFLADYLRDVRDANRYGYPASRLAALDEDDG